MPSTTASWPELETLRRWLKESPRVLVGAGAGMSAAAGFAYAGPRFHRYFQDFIDAYGFTDMYSAGFYPFPTPEEHWGYWSRHIYYNRYDQPAGQPYLDLLNLVRDKDYFVLTTNVDHRFQAAGFDKQRLFYTQGDYGLWQCAKPCHPMTYDNEETVRRMVAEQQNRRVPGELVPHCPRCGGPMVMNLRADDAFVEDAGWHEASLRYRAYLDRTAGQPLLLLELGVGRNTPGIIKYPFWRLTHQREQVRYACINRGEAVIPEQIAAKSLALDADIAQVLHALQDHQEGDQT